MLRAARPFIMLLLLFALPLQGVAAVSAGVCMAIGHHEAGNAHEHEPAHPHGHAASEQAAHGAEGGSDAAHCPPCTSCCAAAHLVAAQAAVMPALAMPEPVAHVAAAQAQTLPEELDRPPLSL